jgi:hypothetical protein
MCSAGLGIELSFGSILSGIYFSLAQPPRFSSGYFPPGSFTFPSCYIRSLSPLRHYLAKHLQYFEQKPKELRRSKMDFLKKGQEMLNKAGSGSNSTTSGNVDPNATQQPAGQAQGTEDYGDKGLLSPFTSLDLRSVTR